MSYKVEAWPWCADYCKKNKHSPYDSYFWDKAMLEYRREHNIFEVGDFIVLLHTNYRSDVFALTKSFKEIYDEKGIVYRHATDAEIQAGRRL